jgi:TolB-like protein/tetratricopeptide (TPR) repeat protein
MVLLSHNGFAGLIYRFANYVLDCERRELRWGTQLRPIEPQVFDLLEYLIRNREHVVGREDLLNSIWRGRIVSDAVVYTRINAARAAVGDNGHDQRLIRTLRSKGFRFVGVVREGRSACGKEDEHAQSGEERSSIAVLPLAPIGGEAPQQWVAEALTEEFITAFAKLGWMPVVSRASSLAYKSQPMPTDALASKLRARYLLQGSVCRTAHSLRLAVQLVDGISDHHLWAERYDLSSTGGTAAQDVVVEEVVSAVAQQIYLAERLRAQRKAPALLNGWESIVRALWLINSRKKPLVGMAQGLMQRAISLNPHCGQAHSLLSFITTLGVHQGWHKRSQQIPLALRLARKALSANSEDAWARLALGYAMIWVQSEDAILELQKALAIDPNLAVAHYLIALAMAWSGQGEQALLHASIAERLGPKDLLSRGNAGTHNNVRATACFQAARYREGIEFARRAIADSPSMPTAHRALLINCALAGESEQASAALGSIRRLAPAMSQQWIRETAIWTRREDQRKYVEAFRIAGLKP